MGEVVLDASALLAYLFDEPAWLTTENCKYTILSVSGSRENPP